MFNWTKSRKWQPDTKDVLAVLRAPDISIPDLNRFPMGIDNAHIDVLLSSRFETIAGEWAKSILYENLDARQLWANDVMSTQGASHDVRFRDAYINLVETLMHRAKTDVRPDYMVLLILAVWRFLLLLAQQEFDHCKERMVHSSNADASTYTGSSLSINEKIVDLARDEGFLMRQITETLFRVISKLETQILRKMRKSVLGKSWPIDRVLIFNPILQLHTIGLTPAFITQYPAFLVESDKRQQHLRAVTQILLEVFPDWLPAFVQLPEDSSGARLRRDQGGIRNFAVLERLACAVISDTELYSYSSSWLDVPINLQRLLGLLDEKTSARSGSWTALSSQPQWSVFIKSLRKSVINSIRQHGLFEHMLVSSELLPFYELNQTPLNIAWLYDYFVGDLSKKDLLRRLDNAREATADIVKQLDERRNQLFQLPESEKQRRVLEQFCKAVVFRRDLKYAVWYYRAMDAVSLLENKEDIDLSASNNTLQCFLLSDEVSDAKPSILAHTIIKADLRGSSSIISKLEDRNLNPAAYFSLNFFNPINELIQGYGATKVFVEGDAIILAILEYDDVSQRKSVARACQLSKDILRVVDKQNASNRKHGFPELETGIGIVYSNSAPAYLYDGDQPIMISPGIHRADRLSSCHASLRKTVFADKGRGVEVVVPVAERLDGKADDSDVLRYNVNGIELDVGAFLGLRNELAMRKVKVRLDSTVHSVYVGRFSDHQGRMRWVMVREAPLYYVQNDVLSDNTADGRYFYEVVTGSELIAKVKSKLASRGSKKSKPS